MEPGPPGPEPGPAGETAIAFVRGNPSPREIAVVTVVLSARARRGGARVDTDTRYGWSNRSRLLRSPVARSPGGWRSSALPR
ncbi:MAG TPA: acyl-CoA carboxylase subunit epsilon [Streptosporangiaceae bacterium]|nr:acyl-CoA carboxylase subunit epsilon [Streptosporangiaceae bacterium]